MAEDKLDLHPGDEEKPLADDELEEVNGGFYPNQAIQGTSQGVINNPHDALSKYE